MQPSPFLNRYLPEMKRYIKKVRTIDFATLIYIIVWIRGYSNLIKMLTNIIQVKNVHDTILIDIIPGTLRAQLKVWVEPAAV